MPNAPLCNDTVYVPLGFTGRYDPCPNKAKYPSGKCGVHDPDQKALRAVRRGPTQWERECIARDKKKHRAESLESENKRLRETLTEIADTPSSHIDVRPIARAALRKEPADA